MTRDRDDDTDDARRIRDDDAAWEARRAARMEATMRGDDRAERRRERERLIPPEVLRAAAHDVHLHAAAHCYVEGDDDAWAVCFDAMRADCARLAGECERMGLAAMTLDVGDWPEGGATAAMTDAQARALMRATEGRRLLIDAASRATALWSEPVVVLRGRR